MECGGVPCAISGSFRHGKGKETPFGRVRAPRGEAPVATQGDPLANAWVIRCGPSMNARTTRCGPSPCFRMESMRKRFACLKGNERKAESTQFRSPSRSRPLPAARSASRARGPCRGPPSAARPASRSRSHVPTSGATLRSEPVGIIPAFGSRCHPIGGIPACAPPHARSHHPCVQFRMQFRCCPPRRHHPDAQSFRNHPDMQPFRCNIVGITRPECTKSPPISCLSAG